MQSCQCGVRNAECGVPRAPTWGTRGGPTVGPRGKLECGSPEPRLGALGAWYLVGKELNGDGDTLKRGNRAGNVGWANPRLESPRWPLSGRQGCLPFMGRSVWSGLVRFPAGAGLCRF